MPQSQPPQSQPPTRRRGRPRTRPAGAMECPVYLSPAEARSADRTAAREGLSRAEWMRRAVLKALES